jgi:hypothetical protein
MTVMPVEYARALVLLAEGETAANAADATGQKLATVVQLARRQGWTIHPATQKAKAPMEDDDVLRLPQEVLDIAAAWRDEPPAEDLEVEELVDELLANARECNDRQVKAALVKAETAIGKLRETYEAVAERIAAEEARAAERAEALAEVAELERRLEAARQRAKNAGAKTSRSPARPSTGSPTGEVTDREVREWAAEHGIDVNRIGRVSKEVRKQYEDAHTAVAS